jgi:LssY-like putative type I secretion system component LssY
MHPVRRLAALSVYLLLLPAGYVAISYIVAPRAWSLFEHRHPALSAVATRAVTASGIPGDPLNVAFVGDETALHRALLSAGWSPADPVTMRSSLRIAAAAMLHRPYEDAPVSALFVWNRIQDFAFEEQAGADPRQRHHVRFWRSTELDDQGRPLWIGAATFDTRVGFSHTTGQITHHIGPAIDAERDKLVSEVGGEPGIVTSWLDGFQPVRTGRNGGGDIFSTDGRLAILTAPAAAAPEVRHAPENVAH